MLKETQMGLLLVKRDLQIESRGVPCVTAESCARGGVSAFLGCGTLASESICTNTTIKSSLLVVVSLCMDLVRLWVRGKRQRWQGIYSLSRARGRKQGFFNQRWLCSEARVLHTDVPCTFWCPCGRVSEDTLRR
jgi:hypothetical protein